MAYFSETQLPRYREDDLPGTVKKMYNFCRELQEMLQFVLSNLDGDNIEGYEEIFNRLKDGEGNVSVLKQTANSILMQVQQNGEKIGSLQVTAEQISARVQDTEKGVADLRITADGISQRVADNAGNITSLQTTASGLAGQVSDMEGNISRLQVTASGLKSQVSNMEGSVSSVEQTASSLSSRVSSMEGSLSTVQQTANSLTSTVSDLNGKYTSIKQTVDSINLTGTVTFNDLETEGKSVINGGNITTGEVDAQYLRLYGPMEVYKSRRSDSLGGYIGFVAGKAYNDNGSLRDTEGIGVKASSAPDCGMVICTDSGARLTFGSGLFQRATTIACVAEHCYSSEQMETFSDVRLKRDIYYDLAEKYGAFFQALRPCRFLMKRDIGGAFQTGFIAQEVKRALEENGLCMSDFDALTQFPSENPEEEGIYTLRYGEFAALNTAMIQQLMARVDALETEVKQLKGGA